VIGNHLPRQCGIATFTTDLLKALSAEASGSQYWALVINDTPEGYPYPPTVRFELDCKRLSDYRLAADFLNMNQVDVVCLQHEFGIFGGADGRYILELLNNLRMPVVTTLHTVLKNPDPGQKATLEEIGRVSDRLVVMSQRAREILQETYAVPREKIALIHHGIPDVPFVDPNYFKDQFGVEGKKVILTFGLLSPGKGLEVMIDALPDIVRRHPDTAYIILGATHPHVKRMEGESYRLSLQRRARELGVEMNVIFHNRFVDLEELTEFLGAADVYVTPYLNREQIVSGTLAYALGTGKATVSTPYWYAEEMLSEGKGRLVPFRDSKALAEAVNELLANEVERHAMRKRAYTFCRSMVWKEVARRYLDLFGEVKREREIHPRATFHLKTLNETPSELPQPKFDHLKRLTDDVGILQHAKFIVPERSHGYCTDDNARALIGVLMAQELTSDGQELRDLACRYLSFLSHALNGESGYFRNFMGYDRRWLEETGSEDSHGRAIWGLGMAVASSSLEGLTGVALNLFERALPCMARFTSPRAMAFGLVGIHAYLRKFSGDSEVRRLRACLAVELFDLYQSNASPDWPWVENIVTYANGKIPQALLLSGQWLQREDMIDAGLRSLEWLVRLQTDPKGHFVPIGNRGWFTRNGERARFDQQPIEAHSMIDACIEAYHVTHDKKWIEEARRAFEWFLGRNDLNAMLYDYTTGGCRDGLSADGPNLNQGAESTLAWLLSLLSFHHLMDREAGANPRMQSESGRRAEALPGDPSHLSPRPGDRSLFA
jgi:glycosyltransferase involved in cell wall biosynthesis